jgi:hypothetical protein
VWEKGQRETALDFAGHSPSYCVFLQILRETADGMTYLHGLDPPFIHRDLKSQNILIADHWQVKTLCVVDCFAWLASSVLHVFVVIARVEVCFSSTAGRLRFATLEWLVCGRWASR